MNEKVNRNYFWSVQFVEKLAELGLKNVCISPGSRNTPLTLAFNEEKRIKKFVNIDERSSAFFALGLASESNSPTAIVTTSGTAVAELYPAIIEAYQQKTPLIICSADRPPELKDCGANQTINQHNIFANHINWFYDLGLPELTDIRINHLKSIAEKAFISAFLANKGPVHLNFPFRKPLEPNSYTDSIETKRLKNSAKFNDLSDLKNESIPIGQISNLATAAVNVKEGLITVGSGDSREYRNDLIELSNTLGYPILSDAGSSIKFSMEQSELVMENHTAFLRSNKFINENKPKLIIHFGSAPTTKVMLDFFKKSDAEKYLVNRFGEWKDPSNSAKELIKSNEKDFCLELIKQVSYLPQKTNSDNQWINNFIKADKASSKVIKSYLKRTKFPFEGSLYNVILNSVPDGSNIMVSNSNPIRDLDYFSEKMEKGLNIFSNRGASGIDGITSTALGIAESGETATYLITGDLAFYHDLNGLLIGTKNNIDLTIVLVNNNGGGIFEMLPIASHNREAFNTYFTTSHDIDFKSIVKGYGCKYKLINSWNELSDQLQKKSKKNSVRILEIKTESVKSKVQKVKCWKNLTKKIDLLK